MPMNPGQGESETDFMHRCISEEMGAGHPQDQAVAMCMSMWASGKAADEPLHRAHSLFEVKSFSAETRTIEGLATAPTPDRIGDIVESKGARFNLPFPLLYQHDTEKPIGHVVAAAPTEKGIPIKAQIFKASESKTLMERLDQAWEEVKLGLVRGLSIGFSPLDAEPVTKDGGMFGPMRYKTWDWLELSVVTVPMHAHATIDVVKSIDAGLRAASGRIPVVKLDAEILRRARRPIRSDVTYLRRS